MLLKVEKENIIEGLQKAASIIPSKTGAAYLRSIWLKAENGSLAVMSTDSNIEFCGSYPCDISSDGLVGVNGRSFTDLLRKLPQGTITLKLDEKTSNLLIEQGRRKYKLPVNENSWFQNFALFPEEGAIFWSGDFLQDIIERISFCIGDEDTLEAIACLYMKPGENNNIDTCGLNGHQFAMIKFVNDDIYNLLPKDGMLIQKKYLIELKKWLGEDEIELNQLDKRLYLRTADRRETFSLPLSAYEYPDYNAFMSRLGDPDVSKLTVDRKELLEAMDRLSIFNSETSRCTYFELCSEPAPASEQDSAQIQELKLSALGQDIGTADEILEVEYKGDITKIAFPTKNLMEIINHYQSAKITLTLTGTEGPCGISGEDDPQYNVIIMPMKMVDDSYFSEEEV